MDTTISPIYLLRSYVWDVLKANTTMDESDYGGLIPIVPLGEEPELNQYSGPHLVYGYSLFASNDNYAMKEGSMTFMVYSQNFRTITRILTVLDEALKRLDDTARSINQYTSQVAPYVGIRFGHVGVGFVEGGGPEGDESEVTEGGRMSGLINIRFSYFVDYDLNLDPAPTI